jgi:hypothetical protein
MQVCSFPVYNAPAVEASRGDAFPACPGVHQGPSIQPRAVGATLGFESGIAATLFLTRATAVPRVLPSIAARWELAAAVKQLYLSTSPTPRDAMQLADAVYYDEHDPKIPQALRAYSKVENQHHGLRFLLVVPTWLPQPGAQFDWAAVQSKQIHVLFVFRGTGKCHMRICKLLAAAQWFAPRATP